MSVVMSRSSDGGIVLATANDSAQAACAALQHPATVYNLHWNRSSLRRYSSNLSRLSSWKKASLVNE